MKFVPVDLLKPGMKLERDLYLFRSGESGLAMLKAGTPLTRYHILRLKELDIAGVYVSFPGSETKAGDHGEVLLGHSDKSRFIKQLRTSFETLSDTLSSRLFAESIAQIDRITRNLVDIILHNRNLLVNLEDLRLYDDDLYNHSLGVAVLAVSIGMSYSMDRNDLYELGLSAILHDVGKTLTPRHILHKPARLTREEFEIMKRHAEEGADLLEKRDIVSRRVLDGVRHHHERYDGAGYPDGLAGDWIPLFARIISVADVYDALTSDRSYRAPATPLESVEYIMGGAGKMFDYDVVTTFLQRVSPYPVGSCVSLSNGQRAVVVRQNREHPLRPVIKMLHARAKPIDLYRERDAQNLVIQNLCEMPGVPEAKPGPSHSH